MGERNKKGAEGTGLKDNPVVAETAFSAAAIDLLEVARITGGNVTFGQDGQPSVNWGRETSLYWRDDYDGLTKIEGQKTLLFWRGQWGGTGLELSGAVMGKDFFAFVHGKGAWKIKEGELMSEVISAGEIKTYVGPEGIFNPVFIEARNIADANLEVYRRTHP